MASLKFVTIVAIVMALCVCSVYNIDSRVATTIFDMLLLNKSTTCVILQIKNRVIFVSTEAEAPAALSNWPNIINNEKLKVINDTFRPKEPADIIEKVNKLAEKYPSFLAYFRESREKEKPQLSVITTESRRPVGLIGEILTQLGLILKDKGISTLTRVKNDVNGRIVVKLQN